MRVYIIQDDTDVVALYLLAITLSVDTENVLSKGTEMLKNFG